MSDDPSNDYEVVREAVDKAAREVEDAYQQEIQRVRTLPLAEKAQDAL